MSRVIPVDDFTGREKATAEIDREPPGENYCRQLEEGNILFFEESPFKLPDEDVSFLLYRRQTDWGFHKNIAYRPKQDRLTGFDESDAEDRERLHVIMKRYSERVTQFLSELLPPYAGGWRLDFASFRPLEECGRKLRLKARNDLLHVDAFPTRPTGGDRILRLFTNINPTEPRVWITSESYPVLARRFAGAPGLPLPRGTASLGHQLQRELIQFGRQIGLPLVDRSPYDQFMLRFHHYLKQNQVFQQSCPKEQWVFPPHSTWLLFTDVVSHAVLSGQFALEQTVIVSRKTLLSEEKAPIRVLESLCGERLIAA
ncbi:MAG: Kdo hydroxylase family protein [Nitrospirae bacterium]|nr:Kdo hydroxylase family protein [Candidatus Manganitrophaceae bacterium]